MNDFEAMLGREEPGGYIAVTDCDDHQWLYHDLRTLVDHLAGFIEQTTDPQDRCLIWSDHSTFWVCNYLAIIRAGRIAVPVPPDASPDLLARIMHASSPRMAFVDAQRLSPLTSLHRAGLRIVCQQESEGDIIGWTDALAFVPIEHTYKPSPRAAAAMIYRVGLAGEVQSLTLTHGDIAASTDPLMDSSALPAADRAMRLLPLLLGKSLATSEPLHA